MDLAIDINNIEEYGVKSIYEEIAPHFNSSRTYIWQWVKDIMKEIPKNSIICDIGCGNGRNMKFEGYKFYGLDNCEQFVDICKHQGLSVELGDMCSIPYNSLSFDVTISIASFHHLSSHTRRINALYEMKRITKPNGTIILSVWSFNQPKKTRREFQKYGDNIVTWDQFGKIYNRYYYIFQIPELENMFKETGLFIERHFWDCGNEIYILKKTINNK